MKKHYLYFIIDSFTYNYISICGFLSAEMVSSD